MKKILATGSTFGIGALLAALALGAHAQGTGLSADTWTSATPHWYGSAAIGSGHLGSPSTASDGLADQGLGGSTSQQRWHGGVGLGLGYQITPNFAVEGAYQDLGRFRYGSAAGDGDWRSYGLRLSAVGSMPLADRLAAYGRGGVYYGTTELNGGGSSTGQERGRAHLTYGAGLSYALTPRLDATAGWDRYQNVGATATGRSNVDLYSVGLKYKF